MGTLAPLSISLFKTAVREFLAEISKEKISHLYRVTDGKAVGTHVEHAFHKFLSTRFEYRAGSSASGIDFPELNVDLKVTSLRQPQSSCPFRDAGQKVFGLGYQLLVLVYDKKEDDAAKASILDFQHAIFVDSTKTADFQTTAGLLDILKRGGNQDDVIAFLDERHLPLDDIGRLELAKRILQQPPILGSLTISNALQWRLQYTRIIALSEATQLTEGIEKLIG